MKSKKNADGLFFIVMMIFSYLEVQWAGELLLLVYVWYLFVERESIRNKQQNEFADLSIGFKPVLTVQIFNVLEFVASILFLGFVICVYLTIYESITLLIIAIAVFLEQLITIAHQFIYPRELYLTKDAIHFYKKENIELLLQDLERIELRKTQITLYSKNDKHIIPFKLFLTKPDFIIWNNYFLDFSNVYHYEYINATNYKSSKERI